MDSLTLKTTSEKFCDNLNDFIASNRYPGLYRKLERENTKTAFIYQTGGGWYNWGIRFEIKSLDSERIKILAESKPEFADYLARLMAEVKRLWRTDAPGLAESNKMIWVMPSDDEARIKLVTFRVKSIDKQDRIIKLAKDLLDFKVDRSKVELSNISRYDSDRQLAKKAGLLPPDF